MPDSQCKITPCLLSDHDFVSFVFEIPDTVKRGPGVWKFNNSLLDDKVFCDSICYGTPSVAKLLFHILRHIMC